MSALRFGNVRYNAQRKMFEATADIVSEAGLQRVPVQFSAANTAPFSVIAGGLAKNAERKRNQAKPQLRLI